MRIKNAFFRPPSHVMEKDPSWDDLELNPLEKVDPINSFSAKSSVSAAHAQSTSPTLIIQLRADPLRDKLV